MDSLVIKALAVVGVCYIAMIIIYMCTGTSYQGSASLIIMPIGSSADQSGQWTSAASAPTISTSEFVGKVNEFTTRMPTINDRLEVEGPANVAWTNPYPGAKAYPRTAYATTATTW